MINFIKHAIIFAAIPAILFVSGMVLLWRLLFLLFSCIDNAINEVFDRWM